MRNYSWHSVAEQLYSKHAGHDTPFHETSQPAVGPGVVRPVIPAISAPAVGRLRDPGEGKRMKPLYFLYLLSRGAIANVTFR